LNRIRRLGRKHGWTLALEVREDRVWRTIIKRATERSAAGFIDKIEVERLFGWAAE
jgi:hypothetical protein